MVPLADFGMRQIDEKSARRQVLVLGEVLIGHRRKRGDACRLQPASRLLGRDGRSPARQPLLELVLVALAGGQGAEARIVGSSASTDDCGKRAPFVVAARPRSRPSAPRPPRGTRRAAPCGDRGCRRAAARSPFISYSRIASGSTVIDASHCERSMYCPSPVARGGRARRAPRRRRAGPPVGSPYEMPTCIGGQPRSR